MDDVRREGPAKLTSLPASQLGERADGRAERTRRTRRTAIVVLGMHRSGTSAISRVFSLLGCDLPKTLMGPSASNEAGHWESDAITAFNEELLASLGSAWDDWSPIDPGWRQSPKAEEFKARAAELLEQEFGGSHLFVLKDPRICRLLPFWKDVMQAAGMQPAFVVPVRNPLEVAASLTARDGMETALGQLIWLRHVLEAEAAGRGAPRFHCSYEQLLSEWPDLVQGVQDALGVRFPRIAARAEVSIDGFLSDSHRHHRETREGVVKNPRIAAWVRDTFAVFDRWATDGENADDYATLDRIRAEFDAAAPAFVKIVAAGRQAQSAAPELEARVAQLSGEKLVALDDAAAAKAEQQRERALSEIRLRGIETKQQETDARLAAALSELEAAQRALEERKLEIARLTGAASAAARENDALRAESESLRGESDELRAENEVLRSDGADLRGRVELVQGALSERDAVIAALSVQLEETLSRDEAEAFERQQLEAILGDAETALASLIAERDEARERATLAEQQAAEARADGELSAKIAEAAGEADRQRQRATLAENVLDERTREIAALTRLLREQEDTAKSQLNERFNEAAILTRLLREEESATRVAAHDREWMRRVAATLLAGGETWRGRFVQLLPSFVLRGWVARHLKAQNLFDADAYLRANPDVARKGVNPLRHYIHHGVKEGRKRE